MYDCYVFDFSFQQTLIKEIDLLIIFVVFATTLIIEIWPLIIVFACPCCCCFRADPTPRAACVDAKRLWYSATEDSPVSKVLDDHYTRS